jgi:hypothetical protein
MRRFLVLAVFLVAFLPVFAQRARATEPQYAFAETGWWLVDGCVQTGVVVSAVREDPLPPGPGVHVAVSFGKSNTCTGELLSQVYADGTLTKATGLDIYTGGWSLNFHTRTTDTVSGDDYEMWVSLQLKCDTTYTRYHPGVYCIGLMSGQISFGRWVYTVPDGTVGGIDWRGSAT